MTSATVPSLDDLPDLLTADEARVVLRVGRNQMYQAIHRGEVPSIRIGRSVRVPKYALAQMLASTTRA